MEKTIRVLPKTIPIRDWKYFHHLAKGIYDHSAHARALRETTQLNGVREYVTGDGAAQLIGTRPLVPACGSQRSLSESLFQNDAGTRCEP